MSHDSLRTTDLKVSDSCVPSEHKGLDTSLAEILKTLPSSLPQGSSLTPRRKHNAPVQKNTPLPIRRGIQQTRLARAKRDAEEDRISGAVRPRDTSGPAVTKRGMRLASGEEAKRRKNAKGLSGTLGRMVGGGATLKLSRAEINSVAKGDSTFVGSKARPHKSPKRGRH